MTDNPLDGLAGALGGLDMGSLLAQAQQMQDQMMQAQRRLAEATVDGTVAGGAVTVTVNGVGELLTVAIRAGEFDGSDIDDLTDLGDLVVAAYRDAKAQADEMAAASLSPLTGGLGEGPGLPDIGKLGF
ncbi:MAG: YbaB/EbfC family nucleoid-associated protein [Nocardioides sp.]